MGEKLYGIDLSGEVTPLAARDAMVECFIQAHYEVMQEMKEYHKFESEEEFVKMEQVNVAAIIKSIFAEIGADFDQPTKKDLLSAMSKLTEYAANFRSPEIIKKHYDEMVLIVSKLN